MITLPNRRDDALERYCIELWQTHGRGGSPGYQETWPTRETFKTNWPHLAHLLIVSAWKIDRAHSPRESEEIEYEHLDPPAAKSVDWHKRYAGELLAHSRLALMLAEQNPVGAVIRRAKLSSAEADAFRLWAAGTSLSSIARTMGRQKRTTDTYLARALWKVREFAGASNEDATEAVG